MAAHFLHRPFDPAQRGLHPKGLRCLFGDVPGDYPAGRYICGGRAVSEKVFVFRKGGQKRFVFPMGEYISKKKNQLWN